MLTVTIKTTSEEGTERLLKALTEILTPAELLAFQEKIKEEIARVEKKKRSKK